METLLDASGLVSFMNGESAASKVESILRAGALMVRENLHEAVDVAARRGNLEIETLQSLFEGAIGSSINLVETDNDRMWRAVQIRKAFYNAKKCDISRPDSLLLATAEALGARIATSDGAVFEVAKALRVKVTRLPPDDA